MYSTNSSYVDNPEANWNSLSVANDDSNVGTNASGNISCTLENLTPSTTYYYRAFVREYNASTSQYEYIFGERKSFTTEAQVPVGSDYLTGYGMPDVSGLNPTSRASGTNSARDDNWYSFSTSYSNRQIAVHTYSSGAPGNAETLNYVVLYDGSKYAPVWTAHTMNSTYWPDNDAGRNDDWTSDPAIGLTQQTGLDNASTVGYSRGHLVASEYRQS
ncbi:MAG: DNA/RNA non-specific endonuclease [Prevotella sp.]|nr:DNA/RNA non-specific endonuclease [Prevotella sp.]